MDYTTQQIKLKRTLLSMMSEINKICEENNIQYFLVGGTLLGAVRHSGFIPWDDDLDIAMPREDYERFIQISENVLPKTLYFRCFENDPNYIFPFGKICKRGTKYVTDLDDGSNFTGEIFIDVFPLDNAMRQKSIIQTLQSQLIKGLKAVVIRKSNLNIKNTSFSVRCLSILSKPFSISQLMHLQNTFMRMCHNRNAEYYVNNGSNYSYIKQTIKKDVYLPPQKILFEGEYFNSPNDTDFFLRRIYGDNYMELPPADKRVSHNIIKLDVGE